MITFLGWLVVFGIVVDFSSRFPLVGFCIWIAFYNPFFWIIPFIALIAFVCAFISFKKHNECIDNWDVNSD